MKPLLSIGFALLLVLSTTGGALAKEQTVTVTMKVTVPVYNKTALGSLILHITGQPETIGVDWTFTGQIDGKRASASGKGEAKWNGSSYTGSLTKIQTWSVPGLPRPVVPLQLTLEQGEGKTIVVGVFTLRAGWIRTTVAYSGIDSLPPPFGDDLAISVTNVADGGIIDIPRTGAVPFGLDVFADALYLAPLTLIVLGGGLLVGTLRFGRGRPRAQA